MVTKDQYRNKHDRHYQSRGLGQFSDYIRNKPLSRIFTIPERVLDLAGGDGVVSEWLIKKGCIVTMADISESAIELAKNRGIQDVHTVNIDEEKLPFEDGSYDTVFWGDNIEHLYNPMYVMREAARIIRKGGRLVVSFPNMGYWYYRYYYMKHGSLPRTEGSNNEPWEWEHIRFFDLSVLKRMLHKAGFLYSKVYGINDENLKIQCRLMKVMPSLFSSILIIVGIKQ